MSIRAAVDVGGTFTDVVVYDDASNTTVVGKTLSTPTDLTDGIFDGFHSAQVDPAGAAAIVHGSTLVINALTERRGARVALVTTLGFRDVYEIGRVNRPDAFDLHFTRHRPLVPRERIFEVPERMTAAGTVHRPLDESTVGELAKQLGKLDITAVAVCLLHAYRNPAHETRVGELLAQAMPGIHITLSHRLSREYREFERVSTTVANAFVGPVVRDYLDRLASRLADAGADAPVLIMQSNGGLSDIRTIREQSIQMMESGPAGGVVGTIEVCKALGYRDAIAFDMGGTTAKASVIRDLAFPQAAEYFVGGYASGLPIRIPCLDIVEVGTGGGSEAWLDGADGLHVGPRSAGASPGPACYGLGGTAATVTDAVVVLGLLADGSELAGGLRLDGEAARVSLAKIGDQIGLDPVHTAAGVLAIAAASMANAVRAVTTERGLDPRDFALVAYGGNGPLHISLVARELGVTRVVVPQIPAVFAAMGMLMADLRRDVVRTDIRRLADTSVADLRRLLRELETEVGVAVVGEGVGEGGTEFEYTHAADMRYVGQEHSLTLSVPALHDAQDLAPLKALFDVAHAERFGHSAPGEPAEIVSLRVALVEPVRRPHPPTIDAGVPAPPERARAGHQMMIFDPDEPPVDVPLYTRHLLVAGNLLTGPAAILEPTTTTLLRPGDRCEVDRHGFLLMTVGA